MKFNCDLSCPANQKQQIFASSDEMKALTSLDMRIKASNTRAGFTFLVLFMCCSLILQDVELKI